MQGRVTPYPSVVEVAAEGAALVWERTPNRPITLLD
jgi:hypothetical protein